MTNRLWIDVEDLFEYARSSRRPSGIQRVAFEICQALHTLHGESGLVRFVRHDTARDTFVPVEWDSVRQTFAALTEPDGPKPRRQAKQGGIQPHSPARQAFRRAVYRISPAIRQPLVRFGILQIQALSALAAAARAVPGSIMPRRKAASAVTGNMERAADFAASVSPGDVLVMLGAAWFHPDYAALVAAHQRGQGMRFALLVHDIIPLRRPEWCERGLVRIFRAWFTGVLPICDTIFTVSRATAGHVSAYAAQQNTALRSSPVPVPVGTGFSFAHKTPHPSAPGDLPAPGSYVLIVATIEARKNHILLFRIWRRMLEEMPRDKVPTLICAGSVGWLVADLMTQLDNADYLDGKIVLIENPTDAELDWLYRGCLFTVFPSLYEGWGLPVTESLAFGKPCVISNRTSLPEAGGELARYFDPENAEDAYTAIRAMIDNPADLREWQDRIERDFRPRPWRATADAIARELGLHQS